MRRLSNSTPTKPIFFPRLSAVYDRAGQNDKAVEVYKKYLDMGNGTTNDLFSMARRYQGLARSLEKDTPERAEAAKEGLKYIDMAIAKVNDNGFLYATKGQAPSYSEQRQARRRYGTGLRGHAQMLRCRSFQEG